MSATLTPVTGPDFAASYLINGDASSLDADDIKRIDAWLDREEIAYVVCEDGEPRFTWSYGLYFPEAHCAGGSVVQYLCAMR